MPESTPSAPYTALFGGQGHVEWYCRVSACPVREVRVHLKDPDHELEAMLEGRHPPRCPLCDTTLALHHVQTAAEHTAAWEVAARCSVNTQMWWRDDPFGVQGLTPATVLADDRLPPTPAGWWDRHVTDADPRKA
jgi:hypothetical protein